MNWDQSFRAMAIVSLAFYYGCAKSERSTSLRVPPEQVIANFLEAVKSGDDKIVSGLLTPLARRKAAESAIVVSPPGSDTARFEVGAVELTGGWARVDSHWTDTDSDGHPHTDRIRWILRQESEGWRITGMEAFVFSDQDAVELNFEDPAEMVQKQQVAEEELARRQREQRQRLQDAADRPGGITR